MVCSLPQRESQEAPGKPLCSLRYPNTKTTSNTKKKSLSLVDWAVILAEANWISWGLKCIWFRGLCKKENTKVWIQNAHDHPNTTQSGGNCDRGEVWVRRDGGLKWLRLKHVTFSNFTKVCGHVNILLGPLLWPWKGPYKWGALKFNLLYLQGNPSLNKWLGSIILKDRGPSSREWGTRLSHRESENSALVEHFIGIFDI